MELSLVTLGGAGSGVGGEVTRDGGKRHIQLVHRSSNSNGYAFISLVHLAVRAKVQVVMDFVQREPPQLVHGG